LPDGYLRLVDKLWAQQWLQSYREFDNTCYALERIAQRRPKLAPLAECNHCLAEHYPLLTAHFSAFYQLVMEDALTFNRSLEKN
jgi:acyl carrier protein phosphodiesterase